MSYKQKLIRALAIIQGVNKTLDELLIKHKKASDGYMDVGGGSSDGEMT